MIIIPLLLLVLSIILLVKSSDFFVDFSSKIAKKLGLSEFVIGLTLVALGTSLPELVSSLYAAYIGSTDIVVGNIFGSNVANIALIIGIGSIMYNIKVTKKMLTFDSVVMLISTIVFSLFLFSGGSISFGEGVIMLIFFIAYTFRTLRKSDNNNSKKGITKDFLIVIISGIGIYFGAKYTIENAISIAKALGVSEYVIAFSIIALGTSFPELSVTLSSIRKGYGNIMLGNIIGSNIANLLLVGGASSLIRPIMFTGTISMFFVIFLTFLFMVMMRVGWKINRPKGIILLLLYTLYMLYLFLF